MPKVWFYLTEEQADAIRPMWEQAREDYENGEKGAIMLQPYFNDISVEIRGGYLPPKYAKRVNDILLELNNDILKEKENG